MEPLAKPSTSVPDPRADVLILKLTRLDRELRGVGKALERIDSELDRLLGDPSFRRSTGP